MALPKKHSRLITVDGVTYRWRVRHRRTYCQDMGWSPLTFAAELANVHRRVLVAELPGTGYPGNCLGPAGSVVTPATAAVIIQTALSLMFATVACRTMEDTWTTVAELVGWLDDHSTLPPDTEKLLRIMKLTEEAGEVTQAVIGTLGQNPRKGVTHTWDDVQAELCDVMLTAMVALATITPDAAQTFSAHLARVRDRSLQS